ncbi:MAG: protein-L-isoaspartate O-methyltransferase [Gammaproteobacteria bacterium]
MRMNYEQARMNMIEQQIRTWEVLDQGVLDLITEVHREDFIPDPYKPLALADMNIPLNHGEVTMTPKMEARIIQSLDIRREDKILEIGTGCGYFTALLAHSGKIVYSIDIYEDFTRYAGNLLARHHIDNVQLYTGDGLSGWPEHAPYDVIAVTGSIPVYTPCFEQQLAVGGRLFVIVGESPIMEACLVTRVGQDEWSRESLFETDLPPLVGAHKATTFEF